MLETYTAIDQNGEPIEGAPVGFFRTGPDQYQDGDYNSYGYTDEDGQVSYVFAGAKAGTATVQGILSYTDSNNSDHIVPESRATDQVTFEGKHVDPISAALKSHNNGGKADHLKVKSNPDAVGAVVKLFKSVNGKWHRVGMGNLNKWGNAKFTVADHNGNKVTRYLAKVMPTDVTKGTKSNVKKVR